MNENTATRENCREVMAWLRGSQAAPDPAMEDRFLDILTAMVRQRIEEDNRERERLRVAQERRERRARLAANPSLSIRRIVEEMQKAGETDLTYEELMGTARKDEPKNEVPSDERVGDKPSELDSLTIGRVIRYMGTAEGHPLNMSQVQIILYVSYGVWLAGTGERLTQEHPQVWQFGPVFPRAYNKLRKDPVSGQDEFCELKKTNPALIDFLDTQFRRFGWMSASAATAPHLAAGTPWEKARRRNPDRWGVAMDDDEIAEWFSKRM